MKKIWTESIVLAEGYDEWCRRLLVQAWWDKTTGTLRVECIVGDFAAGYEALFEVRRDLTLGTHLSRERAIREVIVLVDEVIAARGPEAERIAARSVELESWHKAKGED